jgi:hypothetical protein
MSNSVLFLLVAVGLSVVGTVAVWLHSRPRRSRSSVDQFAQSLRVIGAHQERSEPLSGVTPLPPESTAKPAAPRRREGTRPGS